MSGNILKFGCFDYILSYFILIDVAQRAYFIYIYIFEIKLCWELAILIFYANDYH